MRLDRLLSHLGVASRSGCGALLRAGLCAGAVVRGVQENGIGACVKHFCVNNKETNRKKKELKKIMMKKKKRKN